MTAPSPSRYDPSRNWGATIPHVHSASARRTHVADSREAGRKGEKSSSEPVYDWDRLERAVGALVEEQGRLRTEVLELRTAVSDRDGRVRELEAQLLQANQARQDTGKRIDELISQLDQLDAQLEAEEAGGK